MLQKSTYIEYLLSTQKNHTCTYLADHSNGELSHDKVNRFLINSKFTSSHLWDLVNPYLDDTPDSYILVDDSVQDKKYAKFIELAKRQYSGNVHGLVNGINLVNLVHSNGISEDYFPIDYRIYNADTDGKTKNDHFKDMFKRLQTHKHIQARTILFDSWYGSVDNLKLIHRNGWTFFTTLKSNRLVSRSKETGYQNLQDLAWSADDLQNGIEVKLKKYPYMVRLFKIVSQDGSIEWMITNGEGYSCKQVKERSKIRWQIEQFHREFKQLTGSEKCQCRKANAQRSHLACCYQAWMTLKILAKQMKKTLYQVRDIAFGQFLKQQIANPFIKAL